MLKEMEKVDKKMQHLTIKKVFRRNQIIYQFEYIDF